MPGRVEVLMGQYWEEGKQQRIAYYSCFSFVAPAFAAHVLSRYQGRKIEKQGGVIVLWLHVERKKNGTWGLWWNCSNLLPLAFEASVG